MVLQSARNNPCLLLNQNRKVTVLVLGGVYRDTGGLIHRDVGGLMHWFYTPALCMHKDGVPLRTASVEVSGTHAI